MNAAALPISMIVVARLQPAGVAGVFAVIAIIVAIIVLAARGESRRRRELFDALRARGFHVSEKPSRTELDSLFVAFDGMAPLKKGAKGLRWHATGRSGVGDIQIIEHAYTVSSGKHHHTVINTCVAVVGGISWPTLTLEGEGALARFAEMLGATPDIKLEDEAFNKRWRVKCDDEAFALAVLSPEVQLTLIAAPRADWWAIGGPFGTVCLGRRGPTTDKSLAEMLTSVETLIAHFPPEARAGMGL